MEKILVVSSDVGLQTLVGDILPASAYQRFPAANCARGLEMVQQEEPDLVMLDMRLIGNGGYPFLERFAADPGGVDIPLIMLGDFSGSMDWARGLDMGASDYVSMPLEPVDLRARVGVCLRLRSRLRQLRAEAVVDELTSVYNRRYLEGQLVAKLGEARRYGHAFSMLMLDLDHFKNVNDTLGHRFGDLVLRETAQRVRGMIRKEDIVARYGGEEFAVVLPHTDRPGCIVLGERIREAVAAQVFTMGGEVTRITLSLGSVTYPLDEIGTVDELVALADQRLYRAKDTGRDRLVYE